MSAFMIGLFDRQDARGSRVILDQRQLAEEVPGIELAGRAVLLTILLGASPAAQDDVEGRCGGVLSNDPVARRIDATNALLRQSLDDSLIELGQQGGRCEGLLEIHCVSSIGAGRSVEFGPVS